MYTKKIKKTFFHDQEEGKLLEVTEWANGAGVDFAISDDKGRQLIPLSYRDAKNLRRLIRHILRPNVD
jgi:hypothetical protein